MIGYKIVRRIGDKTVSAFMRNEERDFISPYEVEYKPNEPAEPVLKGSKLYAFDNLGKVDEFLKRGIRKNFVIGNLEVWEAEIENPISKGICSPFIDNDHIEDFWKSKSEYLKVIGPICTDSLNCDSIMLLKKVYDGHSE